MIRKAADSNAARASALARDLRIVIGKLKRRLRDQSALGDLTWSQISVLSRLDSEGPATVTNLAKAEGMRPQSMGAIVAALEAAKLIIGAPDPKDGRQTILSLTKACQDWIKTARAAREDWLFHAIQKHLAPDEQEKLAAAVGLLKRLAEIDPDSSAHPQLK
jgi:DNA-binding MarR family transcriptional regulator